jgi:hypothetical protein
MKDVIDKLTIPKKIRFIYNNKCIFIQLQISSTQASLFQQFTISSSNHPIFQAHEHTQTSARTHRNIARTQSLLQPNIAIQKKGISSTSPLRQ